MSRPARAAGLLVAIALTVPALGCGGDSETTGPAQPFAPQASLRAVGGTKRTDKPALVLGVRGRPGDENIRSVTVDLPPVVLVDTGAIGRLCSEPELKQDDCRGRTRLGFARAVSPAYDGALSGPVYLVTGPSSGQLPDLVYLLHGPAELVLRGNVVSKGGRMQAGVEDVPDTPLRSFELTIDGGKTGVLVLSRDICRSKAPADVTFVAQDGRRHEQSVPLEADCG